MCGICGYLNFGGTAEAGKSIVQRMMDAQVHRGPDDAGYWSKGAVHLGFRRLAVIDLETGQQPVRLEQDRLVLVMNGEIYNFRELRQTLKSKDEFRSKGDAEVLLRLVHERGIEAVRELDGMFAFALWDDAKQTLHLGRDRYGIKPLYYSLRGSKLAFASEVNCFSAAGIEEGAIRPEELGLYMTQGYVSPRSSLFANIQSLPPASVLSISESGQKLQKYWQPAELNREGWTFERAVDAVEAQLDLAVKKQRVSDVPVGVFLSGGVDSGTLAALFTKQVGHVHTFSVGFDDPEAVSEAEAAAETAAALGTTHHALTMDAAQVLDDLPSIFASLDGPQGDATAIPTWYVSRLAREYVTVSLAGEGADEIFGGYARQRLDILLDRLGPLARLVPWFKRLRGQNVSRGLIERVKMSTSFDRLLDWSRILDDMTLQSMFSPEYQSAVTFNSTLEQERIHFERRAKEDPVAARLEADLLAFLPCDLLPKVDRMSMAHSLEVRVPYLDNELVDLVLGLPGKIRMKGKTSKPVLREAAARIMPRSLTSRPKQGFDVPISGWLRGPLRPLMQDLLLDQTAKTRGWFEPTVITGWVDEHLTNKRDHGALLWHLVALEGWLRHRPKPATVVQGFRS